MSALERIIQAACRVLNLERHRIEVDVQIVSPAVMRRLNKKHRGKDKTTDVLSFPLLTKKELSTFQKERVILHIGDIFVNRPDAKTRFQFLVIHGFLHLVGYDHEGSSRQAKIMEQLEARIARSLHATK